MCVMVLLVPISCEHLDLPAHLCEHLDLPAHMCEHLDLPAHVCEHLDLPAHVCVSCKKFLSFQSSQLA
jgi:kynurenine formamidase